jgi:hypothetical protein
VKNLFYIPVLITLLLDLNFATSSEEFEEYGLDHDAQPLYEFVGVIPFNGLACNLLVISQSGLGPQWSAVIEVGDHHDGATAGSIKVTKHASLATALSGKGISAQSEILITVTDQNDIRTATSFNLKWLHGTHWHPLKCVNLKLK